MKFPTESCDKSADDKITNADIRQGKDGQRTGSFVHYLIHRSYMTEVSSAVLHIPAAAFPHPLRLIEIALQLP